MSGMDELQVDRDVRFDSIEDAVADLRAGKMIVVLDDEKRENEGDLVCAAETITPAQVNFIVTQARGLLCVPMAQDRLARLGLDLMVRQNTSPLGTSFTVSVDAVEGTTTGISAPDRAITVRKLADPATRPEELARPGHIFPLRAVEGGVVRRPGHTEAVVDLLKLAGREPVGVLCEILEEDGTMARGPYLHRFARRHGLRIIQIADLIAYRYRHETLVRRVVSTRLPTRHGEFRLTLYRTLVEEHDHLVLTKGNLEEGGPPLVRVHSSCLTGDILGSSRCDCGPQAAEALRRIEEEGRGAFVYLMQEGRGIGLANKILSYSLQDEGMDTVEANLHLGFRADEREYGMAAQILADMGIREMRLMTNNPDKEHGLERYGLRVVAREPIVVGVDPENEHYLATKRDKLGHLLGALPHDAASAPRAKKGKS